MNVQRLRNPCYSAMSFDRVRFASQGKKKGEPQSHEKAVSFVLDFIMHNRVRIFGSFALVEYWAPLFLQFHADYVGEKRIKWRSYPYDIGCTVEGEPVLIVEVGGVGDDTRHQPGNTEQLIKDGISREYIERYYPRCQFERIPKGDCFVKEELERRLCKS